MASRRISSLLSRSATFYVNLSSSGRSSCMRSGLNRYSTVPAIDKPLARPLDNNQLFPYAASGKMTSSESKTITLGVGNCDCRNPAVLKKSWTPNNPGRRFESCKLFNPKVKQGCDHFKWYDQYQTEWQKEVITKLLTEKRTAFNTAFVDISKVISFPPKENKNKADAENEALKIKNDQLAEECKLATEKKNKVDAGYEALKIKNDQLAEECKLVTEKKNKVDAENEALKIKNDQLVKECKLAKRNDEEMLPVVLGLFMLLCCVIIMLCVRVYT